jgi:ATP-binding cassette subfamily F protein uup
MADPAVVADPEQLQRYWQEQQELQKKTECLYDRWNELEQRKQAGE